MKTNAELGEEIYKDRVQGHSFFHIAARLNIAPETARRLYNYRMKLQANSEAQAEREVAAQLELDRLDEIIASYWLDATQGQDAIAARTVMTAVMNRVKIQRLDQLDGSNPADLAQILVIGQSQADFLKALEQGRHPALGSAETDNEIVPGTVEELET